MMGIIKVCKVSFQYTSAGSARGAQASFRIRNLLFNDVIDA